MAVERDAKNAAHFCRPSPTRYAQLNRRAMKYLIVLFSIIAAEQPLAASHQDYLISVYSNNNTLCNEVFATYNNETKCRLNEYSCLINWNTQDGAKFKKVEPIDFVNAFGYTGAGYSMPSKSRSSYALVYTSQFLGDRHPRDEGTWIVNPERLKAVLTLTPSPTTTTEFINQYKKGNVQARSGDANKDEFNALLSDGKKLFNTWSYVYTFKDQDFIVDRECEGFWAYGADYVCKTITSLRVYRIADAMTIQKVCEYTRPMKARGKTR